MLGYVWGMLGYVWGLLKNHGVTRAGMAGEEQIFFLILKLKFKFSFL